MDFWNLADALDLIAELRAEHDALIQNERRLSWREVERRARNLGAWMLGNGASHQGKVAVYTYNHPAYMETVYAAMKAALVPVNVNYRYRAEELRYLLENCDAEFAVVHEDFVPLLAEVRRDLPKLRGVLVVGDEVPPAPRTTRPLPRPTVRRPQPHAAAATCSSSTRAAPPACQRA